MVESHLDIQTIHSNRAPRLRDPQYREVYSNVSATSLSPFDITIMFQKMGEVMPGQAAVVDQVAVIFSPQQFKALVRSMNETLTGYEAAFGSLTISDADTKPLRTSDQLVQKIDEARAQTRRESNPSSSE